MLASSIPGTIFADPLVSIDPGGPEADVATATPDGDPPSANGIEAAG
jgi:hypothetical protein